jgi:hypothetical protein
MGYENGLVERHWCGVMQRFVKGDVGMKRGYGDERKK